MRCRGLLVVAFLLLALALMFHGERDLRAQTAPGSPAAKDLHGDPLPAGAVARLGTIRWRHGDLVAFAAFLPGSKSVVSASDDGFIRVWEYPSGKELLRIPGTARKDSGPGPGRPREYLNAAALSPDGKTIATSYSNAFYEYDDDFIPPAPVAKGKQAPKIEDVIRLHDLSTGKQIAELKAQSKLIMALQFSPNGKQLTSRDNAGIVRIWDWGGAKEIANFPSRGVDAPLHMVDDWSIDDFLVASHDGKTLMFAGLSSVLQFADATKGKPTQSGTGHSAPMTSVRFTSDGKHVVAQDSDWAIHKWDAATSKDLGPFKQPSKSRTVVVISPDGAIGAELPGGVNRGDPDFGPFGGGGPGGGVKGGGKEKKAKEVNIVLYDTATGKELHKIAVPPQSISVLFSPDSKTAVIGSGNELKIAMYDVASGKLLRPLDGVPAPPAGAVRVKGGGGFGGGPGGPGGPIVPRTMLYSPDGKTLAFYWNNSPLSVTFYDAATGKPSGSLTISDRNPSSSAAFSADGRCLAFDMHDGTVAMYELATGQLRHTYGKKPAQLENDPNAVMFGGGPGGLPPGAFPGGFIAGPFNQVGRQRGASWRISPMQGQPNSLFALAPDGKSVVQACHDDVVRLWDIGTGRELAAFKGHLSAVTCVGFAPDGKSVVSASVDTTALIWDVTKIDRAAALRALTHSPFRHSGVLPETDVQKCWEALAVADAGKAFDAIRDLVAAPKETVPWIKERVKPAAPLDVKRIDDLMGQLDDSQYKVRQMASAELLKMGERILPTLEKALAATPSPEMKTRLQDLRSKLSGLALQGERLRAYRAVEVLERIGTPEARAVLESLAAGASGALITTSAHAALKRP